MPALEPPHVAGGCERRPLAAMLRRAGLGAGGIAPLPQNGGGTRLFSAPSLGVGGQRRGWKDPAGIWVARAL